MMGLAQCLARSGDHLALFVVGGGENATWHLSTDCECPCNMGALGNGKGGEL